MKSSRTIVSLAAFGLALSLASAPAWAGPKVELTQIVSARVAKQFLETVPWDKYEATKISVAEETSWYDPAIYLDLKGDKWKIEFLNDRFLSFDRRFYGDLSDPEPVQGDLKKAATELLDRDLVRVYRLKVLEESGEEADTAIILTPYTIYGVVSGDVLRLRLDQGGLEAREGDDLGGDRQVGLPSRFFRGFRRGHRKKKVTNGEAKQGDTGGTFYSRDSSVGYDAITLDK